MIFCIYLYSVLPPIKCTQRETSSLTLPGCSMSWAGTPLQLSQSKTYFSTYFSSSWIGTRKYCHKSETSTCSGEISSISSRVRPFADVMSDLTIQSLHLSSMDSRTPPRMLTLPWYTYEPPPISVVAAKTKVSPLKRQSIPHLELC